MNECWFFETLDASNNIIEQAYFDFKGCSLIKDINLSTNKIKTLDLNLEWSPYLKNLFLDNNLLSELDLRLSMGVELDSLTLNDNHLSLDFLIGASKTYGRSASFFSYKNQYSPGLLKWQKVNSSQSVYSLMARIEDLQIDWYFNNKLVKGESNQLVINNKYTGVIECVIGHPELPGLNYSYQAYLNIDVPKEQIMALSSFYNELQGDKWNSNHGWNQIKRGKRLSKSFMALYGIRFDKDGNVIDISLPDNHLRGYLPGDFKAFTELQHVDVSDNEIAGVLADNIFSKQLASINLSGNLFREFNVDLSNLNQLIEFDISSNHLSSFEPLYAGEMALRNLNISHNRLDSIRYRVYSPDLQFFSLEDNNLQKLNLDLTACLKLDILNLSMNYLKFEDLTPLLYNLPKKVGKLITGQQKVKYKLAYDNGVRAVYVNDVMDKTNTIKWYKAGEAVKTQRPYIGLKSEYYRDYSAYIENPFFPGTSIEAVW